VTHKNKYNNQYKNKRIIFRVTSYNRLSFPVLLNVWEQHHLHHEFEIIRREEPLHREEIRDGDIILFSFMTCFLPDIDAEVREIRRAGKKRVLVVGGGSHVTGDQDLTHRMGFDIQFLGYAETSFRQFGEHLLDDHIQSVYHDIGEDENVDEKGDENVETSANREALDFDRYLPITVFQATVPPLEIMRGCRWMCKYCSTPSHRVRYRSMESIARHLGELKKRNMARVNCISPSSMEFGAASNRRLNLEKIEALLDYTVRQRFRFVEYGIFPSEVRPDTVTAEGMAILKRYVTNKYITIGAQSGVNRRLKELRRGHSTEEVEMAIEIANANGFRVHLDFIVGYPDETLDELTTTVEFIKAINKKYRIRTHLHHFIPLAGSAYAFRLPTFIPEKGKDLLRKLKTAGIAAGGWVENEIQALRFFKWLKNTYPDYYDRYH
jgi:B12-binding domain/radical SAM domain protein